MISGVVLPPSGQRGINCASSAGSEHWSRRPPRAMLHACSWAKTYTHRCERQEAKRHIQIELQLESIDLT